ncbi:hypothetical protein RHECNPAF_13005 [Rhizobium etli CNPAF512]|nr:hypothetical protein RHECNPAF_13005 [Rhizobium etli CNPAF512]
MNAIDLIPELTCRLFLRLAETSHDRSFALDRVRLKRHPFAFVPNCFSLERVPFRSYKAAHSEQ